MSRLGFEVRADERRLVISASLMAAAAGCGLALVSSAADALFLTRVGVRHLGTMFAVSSATLIVVLGYVGAVADRGNRGQLLVGLAVGAAVVLAALGAVFDLAPGAVSTAVLVIGKQFGAAIDLAFWVLVAERFDARQGRRLVPLFVAANGMGTVVGAFSVGPIVALFDARVVLMAGAAVFGLAALAAVRFAREPLVLPLPSRAMAVAPKRRLSVREGWAAVRRSPLATRLAVLVCAAGVFAPILYYLLGAAAHAEFGNENDIARFLGQYRGVVQLLTLATAFVAPAVLARTGVAPALIVAPLGALLAAAAVAISWDLAIIACAQASARVLDIAVQTPSEKLVQNLLPRQVRGRVHGFVDGVAKRAGAIAGGLAASALVAWTPVLSAATVVIALVWLAVALRLRRQFAELAVAELVARGARAGDPTAADVSQGDAVASLVDDRSIGRLRDDLVVDGERGRLAVALVVQLGQRGRVDAAFELATAAGRGGCDRRGQLLAVLSGGAVSVAPSRQRRTVGLLLALSCDQTLEPDHRCLAIRAVGRLGAGVEDGDAVCDQLRSAPASDVRSPVVLATRIACARLEGDRRKVDDLIDSHLRDGTGSRKAVAVAELRVDVASMARAGEPPMSRMLRRARSLLALVRAIGDDDQRSAVLTTLAGALAVDPRGSGHGAELVLLRSEARELAVSLSDAGQVGSESRERSAPAVRAAALELLGALEDPDVASVMARALDDRDEVVRRSAAAGLRRLGDEALEVLMVAASFGRRAGRNNALEVLRDVRVTGAVLDHLVERELAEIDETTARLDGLCGLERATLLERRLEERIDEAAHTLLLVLEARLGDKAIGAAARRFLRAGDPSARARALETLDTVLPRSLGARVLSPLDTGDRAERAARAATRLGVPVPDVDAAVRAELAGTDALAGALVVHALGSTGRASHRDAIAAAAEQAALSFDPFSMLRRIAGDGEPGRVTTDELEEDMPRSVETLMALSELPIFSELTTRQLAELADIVRWRSVPGGATITVAGEPGEALYFVLSGAVRFGDDSGGADLLGPGKLFGEMALFEDDTRSATVVAAERTRLGRIERADFEELVEDVPGIALAICRVLSRRVRELG